MDNCKYSINRDGSENARAISATDNSQCTITRAGHEQAISALRRIANKSIKNIKIEDTKGDNPALFLFPPIKNEYEDNIDKNDNICTLSENPTDITLQTHNIVGILNITEEKHTEDVRLQITSRFDTAEKQYFLQYMLQRVYDPTFLRQEISYAEENILSVFLAMIFPYYLKRAVAQGIYKEYCNFDYNDARVRGKIDIPRHIKYNNPFIGNIAYTVRLHAHNNRITQLICYTMQYLQSKGWRFDTSAEFRDAEQSIREATGHVSPKNIDAITRANMSPIRNPFFTEYEPLRIICLRILRNEGLAIFADEHSSGVHGVLFDCAWLWEEYLNTILPQGYEHPRNRKGDRKGEGGKCMYTESSAQKIYPDFYKEKENISVLDAKYKRHLQDGSSVDRNDLYQIISYLHILKADYGALIYPGGDNETKPHRLGILEGYGGSLHKMALAIPQGCNAYSDFCEQMQENENVFVDYLEKLPEYVER